MSQKIFFLPTFRTLFGGSVGPNRKTFPDGSTQNHYEGIKVRQNPLPLRFMGSASDQPPSVVVNQAAPPNPPGSPILTHLLHRKSPAPDLNNPQVGIFNLSVKKQNFTKQEGLLLHASLKPYTVGIWIMYWSGIKIMDICWTFLQWMNSQ